MFVNGVLYGFREKSLAYTRIRVPDNPARTLVNVLYFRLYVCIIYINHLCLSMYVLLLVKLSVTEFILEKATGP
jgi:hypothetical protein